jgi:hypothetical protein
MSKYGGQLRTYDEPVSHNVVEVLKAGINGYRQDR